MLNEFLLLATLLIDFSAVLLLWRFFGKAGLAAMTVFCTVVANIEVLVLVKAFGIEQTLGNILFGASFLITDILSENCGKEEAKKVVRLGIFCSLLFVVLSQSWLLFSPSPQDISMPAVKALFSTTPRLILVSILVFAFVQRLDVELYHRFWGWSNKKWGEVNRFLWLRNNGSTLISQLLNAFLFNFGAFWGVYPIKTLFTISVSSYLIFIVTSLCDTPFIYLSRRWKKS